MIGLPLAAVALTGGIGAAVGLPGQGTGDSSRGHTGAAGGDATTPAPTTTAGTPTPPATTPRHQASPPLPRLPTKLGRSARDFYVRGQSLETPQGAWRHALYLLARQHLDPAHLYLNYATQSLQSSQGSGGWMLGIKLGWQQDNDSGEGMVQLDLASPGARGLLGCDLPPCRSKQVPGFGKVSLGGDPLGHRDYEVVVRQDDGEIAQVLVTPLFGNDSLTPTRAPLPGLRHVLALATDPAFDLPRS